MSGAMVPDEPRDVRVGEELDAEALAAFLERTVPFTRTATNAPIALRQFAGGFSNLTYLVEWRGRELVLRRPPPGARGGSAHDMAREHRVLAALHAAGARVPRPLALDAEGAVLGVPFYVMERVPGVILRGAAAARAGLDAETTRRLCDSLVATLAEIHAVDVTVPALADLGNPTGYAARQVGGWTRRWEAARTGDVPAIERLAAWLAERVAARPATPARPALVHNDYKLDNLVLDARDLTQVEAVLDWEMATVGDPALDLGTSLAYWADADDPPAWRAVQAATGTLLPGAPSRTELVAMYERATGRTVDDPVFAYALGLFKVAVIAQQIFARYEAGHTKDPRFARLDAAVRTIGDVAALVIRHERIGSLQG